MPTQNNNLKQTTFITNLGDLYAATAEKQKGEPEHAKYLYRLRQLRKAGYDAVPLDGSWGRWLQSVWNKYLEDLKKNAGPVAKGIEKVLNPILGAGAQVALRAQALKENPSLQNYAAATLSFPNTMFNMYAAPAAAVLNEVPGINSVLPYLNLLNTANLFNSNFYTDPNYKYLEHDYDDLGMPVTNQAMGLANAYVGGKLAKATTDYSANVRTRYNRVNTKFTKPERVAAKLNRSSDLQHLESGDLTLHLFDPRAVRSSWVGNTYTTNAGAVVATTPRTPTTELHLQPLIKWEHFPHNDAAVITESTPRPLITAKQASNMLDLLPENTPLSSNANAMTAAQYVQTRPVWEQAAYIATGKHKTPLVTYDSHAYSTDIPTAMENYARKGWGYVEPSVTTRSSSTNMFGGSYDKIEHLLPKPNSNGMIDLTLMTPELIKTYNSFVKNPNLLIDPKDRSMKQNIFVYTGKNRPKSTSSVPPTYFNAGDFTDLSENNNNN